MALTHIDCFSGPGGICTGLHAAGFETKVAIEYIKSCVDTYAYNHPEVHVIHSDIRNVTAEQILPFVPKGGIDLVTSGMPCETFSTAGNSSRAAYDDRQFLFREGIRIAKICNAKMILFENVPMITTKRVAKDSKELIIDLLKRELEEAGYVNYKEVVLDASKYGVPQRRKRFFILAAKDPKYHIDAPEETTDTAVTVQDAFVDIPEVVANTKTENPIYTGAESAYSLLMKNDDFWKRTTLERKLLNHLPMNHRKYIIERFGILQQGEGLKGLFARLTPEELEAYQARKVIPKTIYVKRNYRLRWDEPAPTVTSHCLDEFVHPEQNRALTVRECARLQSFPDSYDFVGGPYLVAHDDRSQQDKYEQIGDAVPPLLAYAWGKKISEIFEKV
ncbi:DNA cytosine methyltransferase [bacterium MSK18_59]|jgi:DNA (cytosine-5)-methyltransferase 1|nr:DNA cytosine methyltransferase [bacterium MSK18_59]RGH62736.1 DNA cytosine methyltransferase [Ruminococcus sp. AM33-14]